MLFDLADTCRILYYFTDGADDNIQAIIETGFLPKILECLISNKENIYIPALLTIRNIVEIDDYQNDAVIFAGGLSRLRTMLWYYGDKEHIIAKETIWIICKLAGNTDQIQSLINADLLPILINEIVYVSI